MYEADAKEAMHPQWEGRTTFSTKSLGSTELVADQLWLRLCQNGSRPRPGGRAGGATGFGTDTGRKSLPVSKQGTAALHPVGLATVRESLTLRGTRNPPRRPREGRRDTVRSCVVYTGLGCMVCCTGHRGPRCLFRCRFGGSLRCLWSTRPSPGEWASCSSLKAGRETGCEGGWSLPHCPSPGAWVSSCRGRRAGLQLTWATLPGPGWVQVPQGALCAHLLPVRVLCCTHASTSRCFRFCREPRLTRGHPIAPQTGLPAHRTLRVRETPWGGALGGAGTGERRTARGA